MQRKTMNDTTNILKDKYRKTEAEVVRLLKEIAQLEKQVRAYNTRLVNALVEIEQPRKDTERLNFIERHRDNIPYFHPTKDWCVWLGKPTGEQNFPSLRAAIDAAREEKP
jgi:hypothetical protein